ncbi:hypothetical protein AB833_04400 [Chromatiales bacterium (ex Bugula neritina AB1)]|nr:hypothetical protein AB833_04400 [Chromatiales bacterium (ex Bugula neritina AB1)]
MTETLLGISEVLMYGEKVADMTYTDKADQPTRRFVRVYGFSYEGGYYHLDSPVIMLLAGEPSPIDNSTPADVKSALSGTMQVWTADKGDHSARLDETTGAIEDILLEAELGDHAHGGRVSGGRVSGGRVSGGRVSGGRVSGGRVSGGKAD